MNRSGMRTSKMRRVIGRILAVALTFFMISGVMESALPGATAMAAEISDGVEQEGVLEAVESDDGEDSLAGIGAEPETDPDTEESDGEEAVGNDSQIYVAGEEDAVSDATVEEASLDATPDEAGEGIPDENLTLSGTVNAADLADNGYYYLTGDTTINIAEGDDKQIKAIRYQSDTPFNLTIQGSDKGKLTVAENIWTGHSGSSETITIKGGTVEAGGFILAGGNISISGGDITATSILSYDGDITITGGNITTEQRSSDNAIAGENVNISGGKVYALTGSYTAIRADNDMIISGGVIYAANTELSSSGFGLFADKNLTISGNAYVDAESKFEAIRSGGRNGGIISIGTGLKITHPSDGVVSEDNHHITYISDTTSYPKQVHIEMAAISYAIVSDKSTVDFGTGSYGEEPPAAETVTITNTGTGPVRLNAIDTSDAESFDVGDLSKTYLIPGESATFTVRPKADLAADTEYSETVTVSSENESVSDISVSLKFYIQPFPYTLNTDASTLDFGSFKEGTVPADEYRTITLSNNSSQPNGTLHFNDSDIQSYFGLEYFTIELDGLSISKGMSSSATIRPKQDLVPGVYEETLVLNTQEGAKALVDLKLEIVAWDYTITADRTEIDFGRASVGYTKRPEAQKIKITNAGDATVTLEDPSTYSTYYEVTTGDSLTLAPGKSATLTVRPKMGLTYVGDGFYVKTREGSERYIHVIFSLGYFLSGNVKASSLIDGQSYVIIGDTVLTLAAGDDKRINSILEPASSSGYNLTIKGNNAGKLTVDSYIFPSHSGCDKTLTITGGTIEAGTFILAGSDVNISGGDITTKLVGSYDGCVNITGGSVTAEQHSNDHAIVGENVKISGGKVYAFAEDFPAIAGENDLTITGGIVNAVNNGGSSGYGLYAGKDLKIGGDAYIISEGKDEAVYGFSSMTIAEGLQLKSGTDSNVHIGESGISAHPGHLVSGLDDLVKSIIIGKDINSGSAAFVKENFDFGDMTLGGEAPDAQIVVVENIGQTPLVIEEITSTYDHYLIGEPSATMLGVGEKTGFTIRPDASKFTATGSFTDEISIKLSDSSVPRTVTADLCVVPAYYAIHADASEVYFGEIPQFFRTDTDHLVRTFTVKNTGNIKVTLNAPSITDNGKDDFKVLDISGSDLEPGETADITIGVIDDGYFLEPGEYEETVKVTGDGGTFASCTVRIKVKALSDKLWIAEIPDMDYTGKALKPEISVYYYGEKLSSNDYTVSYKNNINAAAKDATKIVKGKVVSAAPTVVVKGRGNYTGTGYQTFTIRPLDISEAKASDIILRPTGNVQKGKTKLIYNLDGRKVVLKENKDYTYDYPGTGLKDPGSYTIAARGMGNYRESKELLELILDPSKCPASEMKIGKIPDQKYTGEKFILDGPAGTGEKRALDRSGKKQFSFVIKDAKNKPLTFGTDYLLTYEDNKDIGTATVTVTGTGKYEGQRTVTFKIKGTALNKVKTEGFVKAMPYTGSARKQPMRFYTVKGKGKSAVKQYLMEGVDYDAEYTDNILVGRVTVTYTGKGAYSGKVKKTYSITGIPMKQVTIPSDFGTSTGTDGYLSYSSRYNAATKSFEYTGNPFNVAGPADDSYNYDYGIKLNYIKDGVGTVLVKGEDYTVSYVNNVKPGKAAVIFTGKGRYTGSVKRTFRISPFDITGEEHMDNNITSSGRYRKGGGRPSDIFLQYYQYPYGWKSMQEGVDYTVKTQNSDAITTESTVKKPTVIITGKGCFKGTIKMEFQVTAGSLQYTAMTASDVPAKDKAGICRPKVVIKDDKTGKILKAGTDYEKKIEYTYRNDTAVKDAVTGETVNRSAGDQVGEKDIIPVKTRIKAEATGKGNYEGSKQHAYFSFIYPKNADIGKALVTVTPKTYNGDPRLIGAGDITVKFGKNGTPLVFGTDYRVVDGSYKNNKEKGTAQAVIEAVPGSGYTGRKKVTFPIKPLSF